MTYGVGKLLLGSFIFCGAASAQTIVAATQGVPATVETIVEDGGEISVTYGQAPAEQGAAPVAAGATGEAAKPPSPRQAALIKIEYDRRPSTILKTWSTPPKPKEPPASAPASMPASAPASAPASKPSSAPALTPEQQEAAKKQAEAAQKQAEEQKKKAAEAKAIEEEVAALQRSVTLGKWADVKAYFEKTTKEEWKAGYERMLQSLMMGVQNRPAVPQQGQLYIEKNRFTAEDVAGLIAAAPLDAEKKLTTLLGQILRQSLDGGVQLDAFLQILAPSLEKKDFPADKRKVARILAAAGELIALGDYLPSPEETEKANDREGMNLLSRHFLARNEKEKKVEWLEKAWRTTQAALATGKVEDDEKTEALKRAVDIAPKIKKELGADWLAESFTARPDRGMEILATIGSVASTALAAEPTQSDRRLKWLELQNTATKALLKAAPERANEWKSILSLLAGNWLREAAFTYQFDTSTSRGPRMQRDYYGNYFYYEFDEMRMRGNTPTPLKTGEVLDLRPDDVWLSHVEDGLRPRFSMVFAQLYLKVSEEDKAFPFIEALAAVHPKPAKELVDEFLRVWTKNHDPNSERNRTQNYNYYFYGYEERASGIPLTRSKQERNLKELGEWIERLRKLPVEVDTALLTKAFTTAHGVAEVYRLETIEKAFGKSVKDLDVETLASLMQGMRVNLATIWRDAAAQERSKTKRKAPDIRAEVMRGYELAHATLDQALKDHADSWELVLANAALAHDENNYIQEQKKDPDFAKRREAAFDGFRKAAKLYAAKAPSLERDKETIQPFEMWFYAALGSCDLAAVTHEHILATKQIALIQKTLAEIEGEKGERHVNLFSSSLVTHMQAAKPTVKFRYVREGLAVVGDNKLAFEVRQLYDYYKDLVTEIKLETKIDGDDRVGSGKAFGLRVNLRHTRDIEREAGGFSKYLQNQNNVSFAYNYGRPLEDYRDKFEETARAALKEQFDVMSITFNTPDVKSRAADEYGWRITPYAYILMKARGPQVDRVPALRLDLDFLDTSGYAVLPIESPIVPVDAGTPTTEPRPFEKLKITQTLDERQAKNGKLILEVKATALGLVPDLDAILDVKPEGFDIKKTDDVGVSVAKFDDEEDASKIRSERVWTLTMAAKEGLKELPANFAFAKPKVETAGREQFRYVDADLAAVGESIALEKQYGEVSRAWIWWIPAAFVAIAGGWYAWLRRRKVETAGTARFQVPEQLTPFTVLGLLRDIQQRNGLAADHHREIEADIASIERHFFGGDQDAAPDLKNVAKTWVHRAK